MSSFEIRWDVAARNVVAKADRLLEAIDNGLTEAMSQATNDLRIALELYSEAENAMPWPPASKSK